MKQIMVEDGNNIDYYLVPDWVNYVHRDEHTHKIIGWENEPKFYEDRGSTECYDPLKGKVEIVFTPLNNKHTYNKAFKV